MKKYNCFSKDNGLLKMIKTHSYLVCIDKLGLYDDMLVIAGDNDPRFQPCLFHRVQQKQFQHHAVL